MASSHLNLLGENPMRVNVVDVPGRRIRASEVWLLDGRIESIVAVSDVADSTLRYALPGFIDAHVHIESSMLVPSEFARMASIHGTVATVSDPHEIANVMGIQGVDFMIANGARVPMKFCFGAPSCVPATQFETSGATINAFSVRALLERQDIGYLAEMMNYPGVLNRDEEVLDKIKAAQDFGKPIDGHAPGLTGVDARRYALAGISTDHECTHIDEALHKIDCGMKILIREGSAAKNFEALKSLVDTHPNLVMFCSDDKHPDELAVGHINQLVARAIKAGLNLFNVLQVACLNPIDHYSLPVGKLRTGDTADFVIVDDLTEFRVFQTFIDGKCVAQQGVSLIEPVHVNLVNRFSATAKRPNEFRKQSSQKEHALVRVIHATDGQLTTQAHEAILPVVDGEIRTDPMSDIVKIAVINRYQDVKPAVAFISGFGLRRGAIASSVGHDSHNIVAVGVDDRSICFAVNEVISLRGGIAAVDENRSLALPLPIAGLMSDRDGQFVAEKYKQIDRFAKQALRATLSSPFTTLSFMALLVIPSLKLSDQGLFDGERFQWVDVEIH